MDMGQNIGLGLMKYQGGANCSACMLNQKQFVIDNQSSMHKQTQKKKQKKKKNRRRLTWFGILPTSMDSRKPLISGQSQRVASIYNSQFLNP